MSSMHFAYDMNLGGTKGLGLTRCAIPDTITCCFRKGFSMQRKLSFDGYSPVSVATPLFKMPAEARAEAANLLAKANFLTDVSVSLRALPLGVSLALDHCKCLDSVFVSPAFLPVQEGNWKEPREDC